MGYYTKSTDVKTFGTREASELASKIWNGACSAYGGHSQVPAQAYADCLYGHCNNNMALYNQDRVNLMQFLETVVSELEDLYDTQWGDSLRDLEQFFAYESEFMEFSLALRKKVSEILKLTGPI